VLCAPTSWHRICCAQLKKGQWLELWTSLCGFVRNVSGTPHLPLDMPEDATLPRSRRSYYGIAGFR